MTSSSPDDVEQLVDNDELDNVQRNSRSPRVRHEETENGISLGQINTALDDETDTRPTHASADPTKTGDINVINGGSNDNQNNANRNATHGDVVVSSTPVYYSTQTGESTVVQEPIVVRYPNGVHVIRTQQCSELAPHRYRTEKPLRIRHIKLLQAFSIVAIFFFFPLGIPAVVYAYRCEKEFNEGILRGDIDKARKLAKRTERLIIFSIMGALLVAVSVVAVVERNVMANDEDYWKNRANGAVMPAG